MRDAAKSLKTKSITVYVSYHIKSMTKMLQQLKNLGAN